MRFQVLKRNFEIDKKREVKLNDTDFGIILINEKAVNVVFVDYNDISGGCGYNVAIYDDSAGLVYNLAYLLPPFTII